MDPGSVEAGATVLLTGWYTVPVGMTLYLEFQGFGQVSSGCSWKVDLIDRTTGLSVLDPPYPTTISSTTGAVFTVPLITLSPGTYWLSMVATKATGSSPTDTTTLTAQVGVAYT